MLALRPSLPVVFLTVGACADAPTASTLAPAADTRFSSGSSGSAGTVQSLELRDDCDSVTFNAGIGAGAGTRCGSVTLDKFIPDLKKNRSMGACKNNADQFNGKTGTYDYRCCIHPWMRTTVTIKNN